VVAQVLDHASWVQGLSFEKIAEIHLEKNGGKKLETAFQESFGASLPEEINQAHHLTIVASELDHSTERIIGSLSDNYGVPINAVFFRHFQDGDDQYRVRSWLVDPRRRSRRRSPSKRGSEPWNGRDFYVSLGEGPHRTWADAQRYGSSWASSGRSVDSFFAVRLGRGGVRVEGEAPLPGRRGGAPGVRSASPMPPPGASSQLKET
jgi:hypothetical protein